MARNFPTGVHATYLGSDDAAAEAYSLRLRERSIDRYIDSMSEAKVALAALEPFYKVRVDLDGWEITEPDAERIMRELLRAR